MTEQQITAYLKLEQCREDIKSLPRFKGQQQVIDALKRVLDFSVWGR